MAALVLEEIEKWITQHNTIQFAPDVNDGWEKWAQTDFAIYLKLLGTNSILGEAAYTNGQKTDITVHPQPGHTPGSSTIPGALMELKVLNSTDTLATFKAKLEGDAQKLKVPMIASRTGYERCAFGIAPASRLIPMLKARSEFAGQNISEKNYEGFLGQIIPTFHIERAERPTGQLPFAILFLYVK